MDAEFRCYRCGHSLAVLTLPISRRDECRQCRVEMHVCRMCQYYDPRLPEACAEDDALEVKEKSRANFCDYFKPDADAFVPGEMEADASARQSLGALFGDDRDNDSAPSDKAEDSSSAEDTMSDAESLFK
ncbi:MAG: hypothetical protein ACJ0SL_04825 [Candidatus Rariloculaceae bacterium]